MDRTRTRTNVSRLQRPAMIATALFALISGGVVLGNIDFNTQRVDRTTLSIETVQHGSMEVKAAANGQLLSRRIEQLAARAPGRVAKADLKPGTVVQVGQVLVELTNPQLTASAEEAQSAYEGAVAELHAAEAELQTGMLNQE